MDTLTISQALVYNKSQNTYYVMNGRGFIPEDEAKSLLPKLKVIKDTPVYTQYKVAH